MPVKRVSGIKSQTLLVDGGLNLQYLPFMHESTMTLAEAIPHAQQRTLEGQNNDVKADVLAPVLIEFFSR